MGMILAVFILLGKVPVRNDELQMCVNGFTIASIMLFIIAISRFVLSVDFLFLKFLTILVISVSFTPFIKIECGFCLIILSLVRLTRRYRRIC